MRGKGEGERKSINNHMGGWGSSVNGGCEVLIKVVKASRLACKKRKHSYGRQGCELSQLWSEPHQNGRPLISQGFFLRGHWCLTSWQQLADKLIDRPHKLGECLPI